MLDQLYPHPNNYAQLNQYLNSQKYSNQQLYDYLQTCRNQLPPVHPKYADFASRGSSYGQKVSWSAEMGRNIEFPSASQPRSSQQDQEGLLERTEQHIFAEVLALTAEITQLEAELAKQRAEVEQLNAKLAQLHHHFEDRLCQKAQREQDLTIEDSTIKEVKAETQAILQRVELTKLLQQNIEALTLQNQRKNSEMRQQIQLFAHQQQGSAVSKTRSELAGQIDSLRSRIKQYQQKQQNHSKLAEQSRRQSLTECLADRQSLQSELLHQQLQKREFFLLLDNFKTNFRKVKQNNKKLKQELTKRASPCRPSRQPTEVCFMNI